MEHLRLICLACSLLLYATLQPAFMADVVSGPYHGSFISGGVGLKKPLAAETSPVQPNQQWTIYCWIKSDSPPATRTLLAGFGEPSAGAGTARYLALRDGALSFWSGGAEVQTQTPLGAGKWQFLAATFAGGKLDLYSDGVLLASRALELSTAAPVIYLAPVAAPSPEAVHFSGKIAAFTLVSRALAPEELRAVMARGGKLDLLPFEAASKTWAVQTKGQDGLRAPQEAATLPASNAATEPSLSEPFINSGREPSINEPSSPNPAARAAKPISTLAPRTSNEWSVHGGWQLAQGSVVNATGEAVSRPGFNGPGWMPAIVPGTVLTTLVSRGIYPEPDYGLNNLSIPEALSHQDYWYRTEFRTPPGTKGRRFTLTLHGINYAAQVWLNGELLGQIKGAFTRGEFDIGARLMPNGLNALAIRVSPPPHPGIPHEQSVKAGPGPNGGAMCLDGPTFICTEGWDWIPGVRDRDTGIWQDVTLKATGPIKLGDVQVLTELPLPDTTRAEVSINVPLVNDLARPVRGLLEAEFEGVRVSRPLMVAPGRSATLLSPNEFRELKLDHPRLWWPNGYGEPNLYHLRVSFRTTSNDSTSLSSSSSSAAESDSESLRFGVRELTYELTLMDHAGRLRRVEFNPTTASAARQHVINLAHEGIIQSAEGWVPSFMPGGEESRAITPMTDLRASPFLVIRVNGVRIACKGGNWGLDDSRKRISRERLEPFFRLHREAHLTMIRNWCGQNTEELFYDLADEYGLLVWNDFWLSTQDWNLEPADPALFLENARDTILRFRNHPSIAIWCGRNEGVPPPLINEGLDQLIRSLDGTRYYMPNSRSINLQDSGPWNYGDPESFYVKRARGFSTEIGLPSPPSADALRSMMPATDLWPPNDSWAYHDWHFKGGQEVTPFVRAMEEELGAPRSLEEFERKAQLLNYLSHRAMFEGFNSHLWNPNTGRLMWMSHPAWPSMVWQMYGADYETYGAFFGIRKACEPLHVQLNLPGLTTAVINNTVRAARGLRLSARILSAGGEELFAREESVAVPAGESLDSFALVMPERIADSPAFIKLMLRDEAGRTLSENFYWYAARKEVYRKLNELEPVRLDCAARMDAGGRSSRVSVELTNRGAAVALLAQVTLRRAKTGARVLPVYASDNFISLLPGETRRISLEAPADSTAAARGEEELQVEVSGWNVQRATVPVLRGR